MIELTAVRAKDTTPAPSPWGGPRLRTPRVLLPLTLTLGPGLHALLGNVDDGVALVLAVLAARVRPMGGRVLVLGGAPSDDATRRAVAYVPLDVSLPHPMRVDEALAMAAELRGEPRQDAHARLEARGIAPLATRHVRSLAPDEAHAVALVEAVTSQARLLLLHEPYVLLDPRAAALLAGRLRARARAGACVVVATASVRDAADLAEDHLVFERGALVRRSGALEDLAAPGARGVRLRVVSSDARALLGALSAEPTVTALESRDGVLLVGGTDLVAVASAVAAAALRADTEILSLRPDALALEELRASIAGDAAGAYRRAFEDGRSTATPATPAGATAPAPPPTGAP